MRTSETYEQSYPGNASTVTSYPITFQFIEAADLELIVTDILGLQTILTQPADYVVTRDSVTELGSLRNHTRASRDEHAQDLSQQRPRAESRLRK